MATFNVELSGEYITSLEEMIQSLSHYEIEVAYQEGCSKIVTREDNLALGNVMDSLKKACQNKHLAPNEQ